MSEIIIFSVAATTIIAEAYRSNRNTKEKRQELVQDITDLEVNLKEYDHKFDTINAEISDLKQMVVDMQTQLEQLKIYLKKYSIDSL